MSLRIYIKNHNILGTKRLWFLMFVEGCRMFEDPTWTRFLEQEKNWNEQSIDYPSRFPLHYGSPFFSLKPSWAVDREWKWAIHHGPQKQVRIGHHQYYHMQRPHGRPQLVWSHGPGLTDLLLPEEQNRIGSIDSEFQIGSWRCPVGDGKFKSCIFNWVHSSFSMRRVVFRFHE